MSDLQMLLSVIVTKGQSIEPFAEEFLRFLRGGDICLFTNVFDKNDRFESSSFLISFDLESFYLWRLVHNKIIFKDNDLMRILIIISILNFDIVYLPSILEDWYPMCCRNIVLSLEQGAIMRPVSDANLLIQDLNL